jgi:ParB family chromosome partitioning protein
MASSSLIILTPLSVMDTTLQIRMVPIGEIVVGTRHRHDLGNLDGLVESIRQLGMLQAIGLTLENKLVFGGRRLAAAKMLGWTEVPAVVVASLADAATALKAERDENQCRKPMTPSELVSLGKALEEIERPKATERKKSGEKAEPSGTGSGRSTGDTRDVVGEALGVSGKHYEQAKKVVDQGEPELVVAMDRGDISVKQAAQVASLPPAVQQDVVAAPDIKAAAKAATSPPPSQPDGEEEAEPTSENPEPVCQIRDPEKKPARDPDHPHADFLNAIVAFATKVSQFVNDAEPDGKLRQYLLNVGFVVPRDKRVGDRHYGWQCVGLRGLYRVVKLAGLPGKPKTKATIAKAYKDAEQVEGQK